jgi:sugar porter (SP) family MFS transporter
LLWSVTASLAGFLFGFDTVVISGAEQTIQELWQLSPGVHGMAMAAALYGTVIGALLGAWPADRWGRRRTLLWIGLLYLLSAVGSALAPEVLTFSISRFIGGVGVGVSTVAAPLFISEIAPPSQRGRLAGMFQFNIVFGILVAYLSNSLISGCGEHAWRWMLGVEAFPALVFSLLCFRIPESPRWLISRKGDEVAARGVLARIHPGAGDGFLDAQVASIRDASESEAPVGQFWTRKLAFPMALAVCIAFFNQLSGINAILYFAPRIFEMTGLESKAALLQSVGIGVTNLVFTFVGLWLIDRLGRRTLLFMGSAGYVVSLALVSWSFFSGHFALVPICIFAFIAAHAVGQGAVIWVFISEIFPNRARAGGQALGSFTHWLFAALLTSFFPGMVAAFEPGFVFAFFCGMMVLQWIWVWKWVPETRGLALEQIQDQFEKKGG